MDQAEPPRLYNGTETFPVPQPTLGVDPSHLDVSNTSLPPPPGPLEHATTMCLQNTVLHINGYTADGTTACSIAFSMIFQHNARGYTTAELESKLVSGYREGLTINESCRVLNKVLFAVLAEIS